MSGWGTIFNTTRAMLQHHAERLAQLQETIASGARLRRASDDPADTFRLLGLRNESHSLQTYGDNLTRVSDSLNITSSLLLKMSETLTRVRELVTQGVSGTYSAVNRKSIGDEINSLLEQLVSLANTKEVLYLVNRPGNVPSHTDAAGWIDKAIDGVSPHAERVCVRGDTDFSLTRHFDRWAERVDFIFGMDAHPALITRAEALEEACWERLERKPKYETLTDQQRQRLQSNEKERIVRERGYLNLELNYEDVAEFSYRPGKCDREYRVVVVRKNISRMKGELTLLDEIRYYLLHHHPHRPERSRSGSMRQRAL